jgi:CubicO group peptidase (beta-lactamase class C family)
MLVSAHVRIPITVGLVMVAGLMGMSSAAPLLGAEEGAVYHQLPNNEFLARWLVLGDIPFAAEEAQAATGEAYGQALARDYLADEGGESQVRPVPDAAQKVNGAEYRWRFAQTDDDTVDFVRLFGQKDRRVAYAWTEIELPQGREGLLALGSDDGVRVWLNGALVHDNGTLRAVTRDQDLIPVTLIAGRNSLLVKVINQQGDWAFCARLLDWPVLEERLATAVAGGDLETSRLLLRHGADPRTRSRWGMTALQVARVRGYRQIADELTAAGGSADVPFPSAAEFLDARLAEIVQGESPGAAVLVSQRGEILFEKGYGYANLEHRVPVTPETKFRIGSITKQFTAAAILLLQEQGKLSVDDPLSKFIPDFPRGDEVRIHHLLHHDSGIRSYTDKPDFFKTVTVAIEPGELINSFKTDPFDFSPGQGWHYNNSGYFLLGYIIAQVSGQSYADFLKTHIFDPLQMHDTGVHDAQDILSDEATGYAYEQGRLRKALDWNMSRAGGAGALYSTVEDLHRWNEGVFEGRVLNDESLKAALTPVQLRDGVTGLSYGYGWVIGEFRGLKEIQHGGGLNGFVSQLARYPEHDFTVTVLANAAPAGPSVSPGMLAQEIAQFFLWQYMQPRQEESISHEVDPATYDEYAGRYDYGGAILTVRRQGNRLLAQLTGQPEFEIFPRSPTEFFWKVVDAQVTFVKDEQGKVARAVHRQGGQTIMAAKLEPTQEIELAPEILDRYVGKYDYGGGAIMTVTREDNHLWAQLTGQPKFEIFAKSPTEFFWKVVNAQVTFVVEDERQAVKAIHHQAGREIIAARID